MENNKEPFRYTSLFNKVLDFLIGSAGALAINLMVGSFFAYTVFDYIFALPMDVSILVAFILTLILFVIELVYAFSKKRTYIIIGLFIQLLPLLFVGTCFYHFASNPW